MDLPLFSALLAAFALTLYVMVDSFDLGVGAMLLGQTDEPVLSINTYNELCGTSADWITGSVTARRLTVV